VAQATLPIVASAWLLTGSTASWGATEWQALLQQARTFEAEKQYGEATEAYRAYLNARPDDDEARGALAKLLSWQELYEESEQLYRDILARHPGDREIRTALGRVLSWEKRYAESLALYEDILREAPDNLDARRGLADVLYWSGRTKEALYHYERCQAAVPDVEVARQIERIRTESNASPRAPVGPAVGQLRLPYRDYFKAGYSHYSYTKGIPDERDVLIEGAKSFGDKTLIARVEPLNRFGSHDTPVSAEFYSPLWERAWGYVAGQATVNPSFAPNYSVTGEAVQGMGRVHESLSRLELAFGYRRLLYKKDNVDLLTPGLNIYLPFNLWITEKIYYVPETGAITLSSQLTWRPADRLQLFMSGGFGTSGERIVATQDFTRVRSRTFQGGVIFPLSEKFSGEAVGYYEDRGILYVRRGGTFNLIYHW
jgi:YaiO family outer membrane protein